MQISQRLSAAALVIETIGRLDSTTAATLETVLLPGLAGGLPVVLNLTGVVYVSSAGLRVLLKAAKLERALGGRLLLAGLAPQVREVLQISGCTSLFSLHGDVQTAEAVAGRPINHRQD